MSSPVRVHMTHEPDSEPREILTGLLEDTANLTFGDDTPPETTILVNGQLKEDVVKDLPNIKHLVIPFAGLQPKTREVMLANPSVKVHNLHHNAGMTAEMAMALMLACSRRIVNLHNEFSNNNWEPRYFSRDALCLQEKTALILGFGAVGMCVGAACKGFGMHVVGVRSKADGDVRGIYELYDLLPNADFLFITLPRTDETEGLIGKTELDLLPTNAILINVGRGTIVQEEALYNALKDKRIDSAGIDVWYRYPKGPDDKTPPSDFPFHELPNVVMTPHIGGGTQETEQIRMKALAKLIAAIASGEKDTNLVNVEKGY